MVLVMLLYLYLLIYTFYTSVLHGYCCRIFLCL